MGYRHRPESGPEAAQVPAEVARPSVLGNSIAQQHLIFPVSSATGLACYVKLVVPAPNIGCPGPETAMGPSYWLGAPLAGPPIAFPELQAPQPCPRLAALGHLQWRFYPDFFLFPAHGGPGLIRLLQEFNPLIVQSFCIQRGPRLRLYRTKGLCP
jgi:hypothetical protein